MKTHTCPYCKGSGRIAFRHPTRARIMNHMCTSCNGTGIAGDSRWLVGFILLMLVLLGLAVAYGIYTSGAYQWVGG